MNFAAPPRSGSASGSSTYCYLSLPWASIQPGVLGRAFAPGTCRGRTGPILHSVVLEGQALFNLSFSRQHKLDADTYALHLLNKLGYSPEGLGRFFTEMSRYDGSTDWLSSHPLSRARVRNIDSFKERLAQ